MSDATVAAARAARAWGGVAVIILLACVGGGARTASAAADELRVGVARVPAVLDPTTASSGPDLMIFRLLFQGLVRRGDRGEIRPELAARWSVSRDGLTWTFQPRPGARFPNGSPVTAADVVAALSRQLSADEPVGPAAAWSRLFQGPARTVREILPGDGGTVLIRLAQPFSPLLAVLAHPAFGIAARQSDTAAPLLGTGPYRVAEQTPGRLVLEAAAPATVRTPRLVFSEVADDADGLTRLGPGGDLDVYVPQAPPQGAAPGSRLLSAPTWQVGVLALRTDRGVLRQKAARQAIAAGLDRAVIQPALTPWAWPYGGYLPPGAWGARDAPAPFDPARARRLLAQAGVVDGSLTLVAPAPAGPPDAPRLGDALPLALAAAGLKVTVRVEPPDEALRVMRGGEADMALAEVQLPVDDPHFLFQPLLASEAAAAGIGTNLAAFKSPLVDGMLFRAGQLGYRPERLRLYERLLGLLPDEVPYVPLYVRLQWVAARPSVRGLRLDPAAGLLLDEAWVEGPAAPAPPPAPAEEVHP
jgi:ABC-type transport system substrate-binding protein